MPDHSELSDWLKDPKSVGGVVLAVWGIIKTVRYRRKPPEPILTKALTFPETDSQDRVARLESRVRDQQRLLMQTREELNEVSITLDAVSQRVQRLELSDREDRRQVKDALLGINDRVVELVRRLDQDESPLGATGPQQ